MAAAENRAAGGDLGRGQQFITEPPPAIRAENGLWKEASPVLGHRQDGTPWEGVERGASFPQPSEPLPEHHAPSKPPPGQRYKNPASSAGYPSFTALLYEDQEIRVFENRIQPGLLGPKHTHDDDYWLVLAHRPKHPGSMTLQQGHEEPEKNWKLSAGVPQEGTVAFIDTSNKLRHTEYADNPPENPICIFYAIEIMDKNTNHKAPANETPAGWGSSAGVLYENTEIKIWDLRVPAGQTGSVPLMEKGVSRVFHVDVAGQRKGATPVSKLRGSGGLPMSLKRYGDTYAFAPGQRKAEAMNDGSEPYRGVVLEVKDVEPTLNARL